MSIIHNYCAKLKSSSRKISSSFNSDPNPKTNQPQITSVHQCLSHWRPLSLSLPLAQTLTIHRYLSLFLSLSLAPQPSSPKYVSLYHSLVLDFGFSFSIAFSRWFQRWGIFWVVCGQMTVGTNPPPDIRKQGQARCRTKGCW